MFLVNISQRSKRARYKKIKQCAYTLLLMHLHYSINKAIIINVFYHPCYQDCIISMMDICHNISSGVSKSLYWKFIIKVEYNSVVIFLRDITKKKRKILNYCIEEWHTSRPHDIFRNRSTYSTVCLLIEM